MASDLVDKLNLANYFHLKDLEKTDFAEDILNSYRNQDKEGVKNLLRAYSDFMLRGSSKSQEEIIQGAKRNITFISYIAQLMDEGLPSFAAEDEVKKTKLEERKTGALTEFVSNAIQEYQLVILPSFDTFYNGALYSKIYLLPDGKETRVQNFLFMKRYSAPAEKEVLEHLQKAVISSKEISSDSPQLRTRIPLERAVINLLNQQTRKNLTEGNQRCLSLIKAEIKNYFSKEALVSGQEYLDLNYSLVPADFIIANRNKDNIKGLLWYDLALNSPDVWKNYPNFGNRWSLSQLPYSGSLPDRKQIVLFNLNPHDIKESEGVLDLVYWALATPDKFSQLFDVSGQKLEEITVRFISLLNQKQEQEEKNFEKIAQQYGLNHTNDKGDN